MHSNDHFMLSKKAAAMPFGMGAISVLCPANSWPRVSRPEVSRQNLNNHLIHSFINQTHSL